jgi:3-phenylpropionate/cinnamic acid dioxygenase small subunit
MPISSEQAIANLIGTYAFLVDDGDFAGLGALMESCTFSLGETTVVGKSAVEQLARDALQVYEDGTPRTRHVTTNTIIEIDEDAETATSRSYYTVFQSLPDFPLQAIASGRYRDRFDRHGGSWRFIERQVTGGLYGDTSRHRRVVKTVD